MYNFPAVADFKAWFFRDFPYGTDPSTSILDQDIMNAFQTAMVNFNPALFGNQQNFTLGFLLLAAHFLCINIRASSQGISGQFGWTQSGKGAGSVNESFAIPPRILENPEFAMLAKTTYGAQYLMLILPSLSGQIFSVQGTTRAL